MTQSRLCIVLAAAATILATPAAMAQDRDGTYEGVRGMHMRGWDGVDRGWSSDERRDWRAGSDRRDRWADRRVRDDDEDEGGASQRDGRPTSRMGASFLLRSGDMRLAVRCGAQESMRACVEAATTLLDKARAAAEARPGAVTPPANAP